MDKRFFSIVWIVFHSLHPHQVAAQHFSMEAVTGYPFPTEMTSAASGAHIAWAFNEQGRRNVYVASGPDFTPQKITSFTHDDGQEITSLSISANGKWIVFVRGGDHGGNWDNSVAVNPAFDPAPPKVQVWSVPFAGGEAKIIAEGDEPAISPKNDSIAFIKTGQLWIAPVDGLLPARNLFTTHGTIRSFEWSPDGSKIAFVSNRTDHAFVGVFTNISTPVQWVAPSFTRDNSPRWSPDGKQLVFIRTAGLGGAPDSILAGSNQPWAIWKADLATGKTALVWEAPKTPAGSMPTVEGGCNLHWAAGNHIVFLSYHDGWPHLYTIPSSGGQPLLLTPGAYMVENITLSHDGQWLLFSANTGPDKQDIDRRHVARVPVDKPAMEVLTPGAGLEYNPVLTADGTSLVMFSATAQRPPLPAVMAFGKGVPKLIATNLLSSTFPEKYLVVPKQVLFKAPDGTTLHGQLFEPTGGPAKKPAIVYVHGGPQRQMLLGWHNMGYYSIDYSLNQYLASLGFVVLSVNYRLGIGYGFAFHKATDAGTNGASEYQDVRAAGLWLAGQPDVDAQRIGIYGGSYGGFLTALALGSDSKLFAAGVDIHGVHNRALTATNQYEQAPDAALAAKTAWQSSPVSRISTWTSPVLIIHADDDRNVAFSQSVDLIKRFDAAGVPYEYLVIPDDTHHWMKYSNAVKVNLATAEFLQRKLMK